ncbi:MAG: glutathione S-transferase [Hyphomicrobiaceae bacterium]|nr:glutathione S-transferase [Hyphomicrobiaceae bacterium]
MTYELHYWQGIPGRGEFVRLAFVAAGVAFVDAGMKEDAGPTPSFAPPFLRHEGKTIGQTANVLFYLGGRLGLAPEDEAGRLWAHQVQLTIADFVDEIHDTHHPVGSGLYYEDQKDEALRRAQSFRNERAPKFLGWFETVLARNPAGPGHLVGSALTYSDLSLFHVVEGLRYAFPNFMARTEPDYPNVVGVHGRVRALPRIAAYLQSTARRPFNQHGIFRHYPELDPD